MTHYEYGLAQLPRWKIWLHSLSEAGNNFNIKMATQLAGESPSFKDPA